MQVWLILGNVALIAAALVTTALVIVYGVFSRWEQSQIGRQFMLTKLSLAAILDYGTAVLLFGDHVEYTSLSPARTFIYGMITVIMARWLIIVIRAQLSSRRKSL